MLSAVQWKKSNKISFQIEKRREKSTDRLTVRSTSARRLTNIDFCLSARMLRCGVFVVARFFYEFTSFLFCFCVSSFPLKRIMCLIRFRNFFLPPPSLSPSHSCTGTFIRFAFCRNESDAPQFPGWTTTNWICVLNSRTTNEMMWLACRETFCWQTV